MQRTEQKIIVPSAPQRHRRRDGKWQSRLGRSSPPPWYDSPNLCLAVLKVAETLSKLVGYCVQVEVIGGLNDHEASELVELLPQCTL